MKNLTALALAWMCVVAAPAGADPLALTVQGNRVMAGGAPISLAGSSLFWSNTGWGGAKFYTAEVVAWLKSDWQVDLVRVALGVEGPGGYLQDPAGNLARVKTVVDAAIAQDLYVIIDWHSHHAESHRDTAVAFFGDMARAYGQHPHLIYEIYNEPLAVSWSNTLKPYAEAVIAAIRAVDPDNLIVVGTPNWSQDVDVAAADPLRAANVAYALHFYAGTHGRSLRAKARRALDAGVALFVTEWGSVNVNGDGAVAEASARQWLRFLAEHQISHAHWAINDKREGASALLPGASPQGGWGAEQLTPAGRFAREIVIHWPRTPR